jgi:hypothetical protein
MKRRWFQIHLSTAIMLMFVAGALMWQNFRTYTAEFPPYTNKAYTAYIVTPSMGWPFPHVRDVHFRDMADDTTMVLWNYSSLGKNALIWIGIFAAVTALCELWISYRKRSRLPAEPQDG